MEKMTIKRKIVQSVQETPNFRPFCFKLAAATSTLVGMARGPGFDPVKGPEDEPGNPGGAPLLTLSLWAGVAAVPPIDERFLAPPGWVALSKKCSPS